MKNVLMGQKNKDLGLDLDITIVYPIQFSTTNIRWRMTRWKIYIEYKQNNNIENSLL